MNTRMYTRVLEAALVGDEDETRRTLAELNESEASRLRNTRHNLAELAEGHRKNLWRRRNG